MQREKSRIENGSTAETPKSEETEGWGGVVALKNGIKEIEDDGLIDGQVPTIPEHAVKKFRGIPEDVKLFEVFWQQIVELIKVSFSFIAYIAFAEL